MSALEKGTGFEIKLAELFKQKGYHVSHNIKMKGKSGAEHQIDILAEYKAPLHTSTVIIEAKSYQSNIDKDIIMKLVQIQQDLSADRAILATTSNFTPGALQTAQQYNNVELWSRQKITNHLGEMQLLDTTDSLKTTKTASIKAVAEKISLQQAEQYGKESAKKRSKGGFLGRGKVEEKFLGAEKLLYPYYDVDMKAQIRVVEKTGWFSKEEVTTTVSSRTGVDGNTGAIIDIHEDQIQYYFSYLSNLSQDEIQMLYYIAGVKSFEKRNLSAIGWSPGKITKTVNSLAGKGLIQQTSTRPVIYKRLVPYPSDPSIFVSLMERYHVSEITPKDKKLDANFPAGSIATVFDKYWSGCKIKSIDLVYYPYYAIIYERMDGTKRQEIIDGVTGKRQEYLESVVSADVVT